jgi:hypothetical protein
VGKNFFLQFFKAFFACLSHRSEASEARLGDVREGLKAEIRRGVDLAGNLVVDLP